MTYYKVISKENKSCHGGDFDWTPYLPEENKPGKWTPEIKDTEECIKGYHVTQYWNMWYKKDCRIFKCEVKGCTCCEYPGVIGKEVCTSIRLVKEIFPVFDKNSNTGCWNTGDWNTGDCNTGNWNTGNRNTGDSNTGNRNTGYWNTGDCNTSDRNTGNWNTGDCNTGDRNTGNWNTGNWNTGDRNTGNCNTGNWNTGNMNTGFFNTVDPDIQVFNKPCRREDWENVDKPSFIYFPMIGTMLESWRKAYDSASDEEKLSLVKLPNFNAKVFQEISGILVDEKTGQEVL
jgi:hypothetical protein